MIGVMSTLGITWAQTSTDDGKRIESSLVTGAGAGAGGNDLGASDGGGVRLVNDDLPDGPGTGIVVVGIKPLATITQHDKL